MTRPRILNWPDGRRAAFHLAFDDGCDTHLDRAIPLLRRFGAVGTFYCILSGGPLDKRRREWEAAATDPCVALGNHTLRHVGATDAAQLEEEIASAQEAIHALAPHAPWPRLLPFGQPGGVPWQVTPEEVAAALRRHRLVARPPFVGAGIHIRTIPEALRLVDDAVASGTAGHLDFHGVGGDWLSAPAEMLEAVLERLAERRDEIWLAPTIDCLKYAAERDATRIETVSSEANRLELRLSTGLDAAFYDLPLTVEVDVPKEWTRCRIEAAGLSPSEARPDNGLVRLHARPGPLTLLRL